MSKEQKITVEQFQQQYPELGRAIHEVAKRYQIDLDSLGKEFSQCQKQLNADYEDTINQITITWFNKYKSEPQFRLCLVKHSSEEIEERIGEVNTGLDAILKIAKDEE